MPDSDLGAVLGSGVRDVGGAVVGHDSFNGDAVGGEPGDGPIEERDAGGCFLVGQDLDVGDAAGDVVAGFVETAELFDVDVDQLAGMAAAIPIRFNTVVTVDNAMSSFSAICGPVMRSWRNCSMSRFGLGRCVRRRRALPRMTDPSSAHPRRNEPTTSGR